MYKNLRNTLRARGISTKAYAEFLGVTEKTANNKINHETQFSLPEYRKTCKFLFPDIDPDYLFAEEQTEPA